MDKQFLVEIGIEEMPSRYCQSILKQLSERKIAQIAKENNLTITSPVILITPRRIALLAKSIQQIETTRTVKGPLYDVAYPNDKPNNIASKFAQSHNIDIKEIEFKEFNGRKFLVVDQKLSDKFNLQVQSFVTDLVTGLSFDRSMRWNSTGFKFIRPVRWLICMIGTETIDIKLLNLKAYNISYGNRFLGSPEVKIQSAAKYEELLAKKKVIVDQDKRRKIIETTLLELNDDKYFPAPDPDDNLLNEVTFLVENPIPIVCEFKKEFLSLPKEIVQTVLANHQKYFPLLENNTDQPVSNKFLVIANHAKGTKLIKEGNEKVVNARLKDGIFFFEQDKQHNFEEFLQKTKTITFQEKLGSMWDKTQRLNKICKSLTAYVDVNSDELDIASRFCKADLTTKMVSEFTSLEGTMGRIYFALEKQKPEVATAIEEHYKPRYSEDSLPANNIGMILALADKIDTLYGLFSINIKPKGSSDPYGLRRAAIAIIRILWEKDLDIPLDSLIAAAGEVYDLKADRDEIKKFLLSRLEQYIKESTAINDTNLLRAILFNDDQILKHKKHLIEDISKTMDTEKFKSLIEAIKRVFNISKNNKPEDGYTLEENQIKEFNKSEVSLYSFVRKLTDTTEPIQTGDIYELTDLVNTFFEKNMVLSEDTEERNRRVFIANSTESLINRFLNTKYLFS